MDYYSSLIELTFISVFYLVITGIKCELNFTIVHTNDVHARFDQMNKHGGQCGDEQVQQGKCYGGIARRMTAVREIRKNHENVLFLDAGDQFQGTLWFFIHQGTAAAHFMNLLDYDAMSLGNHEFDNGIQGVLPFLRDVRFPVLACNIDASHEQDIQKYIQKSKVFEFGSKKVGVIGFLTADTPELSSPGNLVFLDVVESIQKEVTSLRASGVEILIALGHSGYSEDKMIAENVAGLDIVIGGHTNTFLYTGDPPSIEVPEGPYPTVVTQSSGHKVLVIQNFAFGKYLGYLNVVFNDDGEVQSWMGNPVLLDDNIKQDYATLVDMKTWRNEVEKIDESIVGYSNVFIEGSKQQCRLRECTMGNMLTDAQLYRHLAKQGDSKPADAAILNSGSIRASIEEGNITMGDLTRVQPFSNTVDVIEIRGKHIREIFEHSIDGYNPEAKHGKFLQVAGLRILYDISEPTGQKVRGICVRLQRNHVTNYHPMIDDQLYRVVVPSYIIKGGDGYDMVLKNAVKHELFEALDVDVTREYITHHNPVNPTLEGRITFVSENTAHSLWGCDAKALGVTSAGNALRTSTTFAIVIFISVCMILWKS